MMCPRNVLFGYLPEAITVSGREYPINADFRTWLMAGEIMRSEEAVQRKIPKLFDLCFKDELPESEGAALSGIMSFYKNAFPAYKSSGGADFSAVFDAQVIYSGFMKCYGIDLSKDNIHWYRFAPLFYELSDCAFSTVMAVRSAKVIPKGREKQFAKIKASVTIPDSNTDFAQSLAGLF